MKAEAAVRIVSWIVAYRVGAAARAEGDWFTSLDPQPTLALLQEANPNSIDALCRAVEFTWWRLALDIRAPEPDDRPVHRRGVAIVGRGPEPASTSWTICRSLSAR